MPSHKEKPGSGKPARERIVDALMEKGRGAETSRQIIEQLLRQPLPERLKNQAAAYMDGRIEAWHKARPKDSMIRDPAAEAEKGAELKQEIENAAREIGVIVGDMEKIPDEWKRPETQEKVRAMRRHLDLPLEQTMQGALQAVSPLFDPLITDITDLKEGIESLVASVEHGNYENSDLRKLMEQLGKLGATCQHLEETSAAFRGSALSTDHVKAFARMVDLLKELQEGLTAKRYDPAASARALVRLSKEYLYFLKRVGRERWSDLLVYNDSPKVIREEKITEAERIDYMLKAIQECMLSAWLTHRLIPYFKAYRDR